MKFIISAGGQGTKIWPYSRKSKPKQFQTLVGTKSLFTYNIDVLLEEFPPEDIFISTKKQYVALALEQAPKIPIKNYIIEPDIAKNRGPAEGFAFLKLSLMHPNEPFMIVQVDDIRLPKRLYLDMIYDLDRLVRRDKKFITGGIKPEFPVLGVDYMEIGERINLNTSQKIYKVKKFLGRETEYSKTKKIIEQKDVLIHCNHACWYPDLMLDAYRKYRPDWYEKLMEIKQVIGTTNEEEKIEKIYAQMEEGATELVTTNIFAEGYLIALPFKWVDIGTWNSLYEYVSESGGKHLEGNVIALDSIGTLVRNTNKDKLIATFGLKDMVIIDTEDILLIIPRDKADKIGEVQKEIKKQNLEQYL